MTSLVCSESKGSSLLRAATDVEAHLQTTTPPGERGDKRPQKLLLMTLENFATQYRRQLFRQKDMTSHKWCMAL